MNKALSSFFKSQTIILSLVLFAAGLLRLFPHPPNLTPVVAIAILSTIWFSDRRLRFGVPVAIMIATDLFIGFHNLAPLIYLSMIAAGLFGRLVKDDHSIRNGILASVSGSLLFFVLSNLGVWAFGGLYPKTMAGVISCYAMAVPFFHNTVLATTALVVGGLSVSRLIETLLVDTANLESAD